MVFYKKRSRTDYIIYTAVIVVGIILDQLTKFLVTRFMVLGESIPLIRGFLHITYTTNPGAAFGMMGGSRWVFMTVSIIAILAFALYLYLGHEDNRLSAISLAMIVSGGIGNMIDRLGLGFYVNAKGMGEVVDFIDFCGIWNAVFNGADSFVCVGAGLMILALLIEIWKETKVKKEIAEKNSVDSKSEEKKDK